MSDDEEKSTKLFDLMNFIVRRTITDESFVEAMFDGVPEEKKDSIDRRDSEWKITIQSRDLIEVSSE